MSYALSREFTLVDPKLAVDPYPIYAKMRVEAPIYWDEQLQAWLVSRYTDVNKLLADSRLTTTLQPPSPDDPKQEARRQIWEMLSKTTFWAAARNHAQLRKLAEKAFTQKILGIGEPIQQIVNSLLDAVQEKGRVDIARDVSDPLPAHILSRLLALPLEGGKSLKQWGFTMVTLFESPRTTQEEDQQILQDLLAVTSYVRGLVRQRIQEPKDDMISVMAAGEDSQDPSLEASLIQAVLMLPGGTAIATYPISSGIFTLLRHPDQMQKLQDDPTLIDSAVEELLRYETPLQWVRRRATEDIELHEQLIRKDQMVLLGLASANRDETHFSHPKQFDIRRNDNHHIGFGHGPHYCLGASLFRLQAKIAINTILRRFKGLRLETNNPEWVNAPSFRGLNSLLVTFEV